MTILPVIVEGEDKWARTRDRRRKFCPELSRKSDTVRARGRERRWQFCHGIAEGMANCHFFPGFPPSLVFLVSLSRPYCCCSCQKSSPADNFPIPFLPRNFFVIHLGLFMVSSFCNKFLPWKFFERKTSSVFFSSKTQKQTKKPIFIPIALLMTAVLGEGKLLRWAIFPLLKRETGIWEWTLTIARLASDPIGGSWAWRMGFEIEEHGKLVGGMENSSTLFEKVVPVRVNKANSEDRHMDLTARFIMGLSKIHRTTKVRKSFLSPLFFLLLVDAYHEGEEEEEEMYNIHFSFCSLALSLFDLMKEKKKRCTKYPFLPSFILFSSLWYDEGEEEEEMYNTHFSIFFLSLSRCLLHPFFFSLIWWRRRRKTRDAQYPFLLSHTHLILWSLQLLPI